MDLLLFIAIIIICCITGKTFEKIHYISIRDREIMLIREPYITYGNKLLDNKKVERIELVSSNVVIGCDKFSSLCANLKNIFGGNVPTFESALDRGRREVLLRIREKAKAIGANILINVKYETINLNPIEYSQDPMVSITAYGTAIKYERTQQSK